MPSGIYGPGNSSLHQGVVLLDTELPFVVTCQQENLPAVAGGADSSLCEHWDRLWALGHDPFLRVVQESP